MRYVDSDTFIDYRGRKVESVLVNSIAVKESSDCFKDHRIYLPKELLKVGDNQVTVKFHSDYVRDCQGIHYFKDQDDQEEYLYSQFESADAHKCFPCFDQPDLKATF